MMDNDIILKNIGDNVAYLRKVLKLNQKEFIAAYLSYESGDPTLSSGAFSNLEHGICKRAMLHAERIGAKLGADPAVFYQAPDQFKESLAAHGELMALGETEPEDSPLGSLQLPSAEGTASNADAVFSMLSSFICDGLMEGTLKPKDKLPSDRDLAAEMNVGRNAVREALRVLSMTGLVKTLPGQGTFIAADPSKLFLKPFAWSFLLGERNGADIIETRNVIEIGMVKAAVVRATNEDILKLRRIYNNQKIAFEAGSTDVFGSLDIDFHLAIAACSHNSLTYEMLAMSQKMLKHISDTGNRTPGQKEAIFKEHTDIFDAIVNRQPERAQAAMEYHLTAARSRYMDL